MWKDCCLRLNQIFSSAGEVYSFHKELAPEFKPIQGHFIEFFMTFIQTTKFPKCSIEQETNRLL